MKTIRGEGMPSYRHHNHGNLYIRFEVLMPDKNWTNDPAAFEALRNALPSPSVQNIPPTEAMTETGVSEDISEEEHSQVVEALDAIRKAEDKKHQAGMEDEYGGAGGREHMQCASQ